MKSNLTIESLHRIIYVFDTIYDDFEGDSTPTHIKLIKPPAPWETSKEIKEVLKSYKRSPIAQLRYIERNRPKLFKLFTRKYYSIENMITVSNATFELLMKIITILNNSIPKLNHIRNYTSIKLTISACFEILSTLKEINIVTTRGEQVHLSSVYIKEIEYKLTETHVNLEKCAKLNEEYIDIVRLLTDKLTLIRSKYTRHIFYPPVKDDLIEEVKETQSLEEEAARQVRRLAEDLPIP